MFSGSVKGDRVAYCQGAPGAYAEANVVDADRVVAWPDFISDEQAAAVLLKGLTAAYLLHHTFPVQAGGAPGARFQHPGTLTPLSARDQSCITAPINQ
ncbi:hypothetical protein ACSV5M_18060 [Cellvibrio sp. ARAG 10.3]|uniref:hypothetical protein n=1 Tax=Cellvibrio sp. ARAG 10.3 TaxID=3451358 RepID=UPI003F45012F